MRDLIVTQNITVDGVIEAGDWFGPADGGADVLEEVRAQSARADAFLTGRQTFEDMREYWPKQLDDETGVTAYLNKVQKYVVSSTLEEPGWEPTAVLRGLDEVRQLKEADGADIVCTGSIRLAHQLIAADLVDEYRLFVYPTVVGSGRRLFVEGGTHGLRLTGSRTFAGGVVLLTYRQTTG